MSARDDDGSESTRPFRTPGQLALAMPLVAVLGLMGVVSAAALGGSAQLVAILSVGGFALCAVAPMALLDIFVGRPLRAAAARLRAARDGRPLPDGGAFAVGVVADIVHLADDARAAQARLGEYGATLNQCEKMIAAGDEAIRAFRLHSEELAEATALGESQMRRASQGQFAEIAEAVKALRASLPANLDGAFERIESMLVYVGETLDRRDGKDKIFEGAFGRVEKSFTDLARLVARETEAVQGSLSNAATMLRNDIAANATEDKTARARLVERIETAEARVLAKLFDAAPPEASRIVETIRAESETTRRALRERVEQVLKDANVAPPETEERNRRVEAAAEIVASASERLAGLAEQIGERLATVDRLAEAVPAAQSALEETVRKLDDAAAALAPAADEDLRGEMRDLAASVSRLGDALASIEASASTPAANIDAPLAALAEASETLARNLTRLDAISPAADVESLRSDWRATVANLAAAIANLGARLDAAPASEPVDEIVARGVAEIAERLAEQTATQGERIEQIETRVVQQILAVERDAEATTLMALVRATQQIGGAVDRLEEISAAAGKSGAAELQGLRAQIDDLASAVAAAARPEASGQGLQGALAEITAAATGRGEALAAILEKLDNLPGALKSDILTELEDKLDRVHQSVASAGERIESGRGADMASLRAGFAALGELVDEATASFAARVEAASQAQAERLEAISGALPASDALSELGARIEALGEAVAAIGVGAETKELRADVATLSALVETATQAQAERLDTISGALAGADARETLAGLDNALRTIAERLETVDQGAEALSGLTERLGVFVDSQSDRAAGDESLRAQLRAAGETMTGAAAQLDAVAAEHADRLDRLEIKLVSRSASLDRSSVATALTVFRTLARELKETTEALRGPMSAAPDATPAEGRLEAELSALGRSVGEALTRFESRLDALAGDQAERMDELETRVVGHVAALDRTEVASALTVFRELSRELGEAVSRLGAAPDPESQPANALIGDLGERLDALARTHSDKLDALELRLATQGASFDRTAVATALGALRAMGQTMQATTERFEAAVAAVEAHASAPLASPDLGTLAGEIAEIGGRLDAFASVQAEEVRRIVAKSGADGAAIDELRHDLRDLGARLAQSLAELTARLEQQSTSSAPASDGPALRDEFDRLGGRLADTLFDLERRMAAHVTARPAAAAVAPSESRSPGAVAKVVVSLADSLDFRFSQIELSLAELSLKAPGAAGRQENAATAAEMTSILTQVRAASDALKAGLSEFIGVSAALAEDVSVTKRAINGKSAA